MPDRDVKTILDVINFQYAKIIACSAFGYVNGTEAKKERLRVHKKYLQAAFIRPKDMVGY